jgi:putative flippase GtrA
VKFFFYVAVGGTCALLNLAMLWLLTDVVGLHYLLSTTLAFFALTPVGFVLQKLITFRTPAAHAGLEWPRYFATMGSSFAASVVLMYALVSLLGIWYLAANVITTVLLLVANFLVNLRWSFRAAQ